MFNEKRSSMLHGVLLIALFSCAAFYIGEMSFVRSLSFSPMIVGIILGMLYANSLRNNLPETWVPGIQFCSKKILRIGIILYGFRLTFQDVLAIGLPAMLIDVIIVVVTICGGIYLGKLLKWTGVLRCSLLSEVVFAGLPPFSVRSLLLKQNLIRRQCPFLPW